jgi:hypothetical protein
LRQHPLCRTKRWASRSAVSAWLGRFALARSCRPRCERRRGRRSRRRETRGVLGGAGERLRVAVVVADSGAPVGGSNPQPVEHGEDGVALRLRHVALQDRFVLPACDAIRDGCAADRVDGRQRRATVRSLNTCPYLASSVPPSPTHSLGPIRATTTLTQGDPGHQTQSLRSAPPKTGASCYSGRDAVPLTESSRLEMSAEELGCQREVDSRGG